LSPGKAADLVVLDKNILEGPADDIPNAGVIMTVLDGEIVYEA
jgi:hypothetical protein